MSGLFLAGFLGRKISRMNNKWLSVWVTKVWSLFIIASEAKKCSEGVPLLELVPPWRWKMVVAGSCEGRAGGVDGN